MKSWFEYRVDAVLRSFAVFFREATGIIIIVLMLMKFGGEGIAFWDMNEMMFLYSLLFLTYGILIIFFTGLRDFGTIIQNGTFDRILLRPRGLLFQIIAINADWFAALGHGGLGITLFIISANRVHITWNAVNILYYILAVIGGVLIQGAIFLFFASLSFFFIKVDNIRNTFYWTLRRFAGYPISIFPKLMQYIIMYVIPLAFVNYFPAQYLIRNRDIHLYPKIYMYLTPVIGVFMYLFAYGFWRFSVRYYKSTGN